MAKHHTKMTALLCNQEYGLMNKNLYLLITYKKIVNKIYVACVLCSFDVGMNQSALKLDSCLMRYTDWTDDERADFLLAIGEQTRPDGRDTNLKKMYRLVKSKNKREKRGLYIVY